MMPTEQRFPKRAIDNPGNRAVVEILLPSGHVALIDAADYLLVSPYRWFASQQRSTVYVLRFETVGGKRRAVYLHRQILDAPKGLEVDHINRNALDCRRANLRMATRLENTHNRRMLRSGLLGVCASKTPGSFYGRIVAAGQSFYTRRFNCPILAAAARDVLAQRVHGKFATLNFQFIPVRRAA